MNELISIVITVYNTEEYLDKCISSILAQVYHNIEIIIVNDGSKGDVFSIIEKYDDERIRYLDLGVNKGLFCARVEGVKISKGDYICFVDSDDFISPNYIFSLHETIVVNNSEIAIASTVEIEENSGEKKFLFNSLQRRELDFDYLDGLELKQRFWQQAGSCFYWHNVWNKLYSRKLMERCLPFFEKIKRRVVMTEDILFSSIFLTEANSISYSPFSIYYYYRNINSSTRKVKSNESIKEDIDTVVYVFECVKEFLIDRNYYATIKNYYKKFANRYFIMWSNAIKSADWSNSADIMAMISSVARLNLLECTKQEGDGFFNNVKPECNLSFFNYINELSTKQVKNVYFNINTLIKRYIYERDKELFTSFEVRNAGKYLFNYARNLNKRIVVITGVLDNYIEILSSCGYNLEGVLFDKEYNEREFVINFENPEIIYKRYFGISDELVERFEPLNRIALNIVSNILFDNPFNTVEMWWDPDVISSCLFWDKLFDVYNFCNNKVKSNDFDIVNFLLEDENSNDNDYKDYYYRYHISKNIKTFYSTLVKRSSNKLEYNNIFDSYFENFSFSNCFKWFSAYGVSKSKEGFKFSQILLNEALKNGKKLAVWGTGRKAIELYNNFNIRPEIYIDSDINKQGKFFNNREIVQISKDIEKNFFIIVAVVKNEDIVEKLKSDGLKPYKDYCLMNCL